LERSDERTILELAKFQNMLDIPLVDDDHLIAVRRLSVHQDVRWMLPQNWGPAWQNLRVREFP